MKGLFILLVSILIIQESVAPPVTKEKKEESENVVEDKEELADVMEYHRYLQEVVQALESDPDFRSKLEKADEKEIRNGQIANELEFVNHHVRTKLDELKRMELERLRHLAIKEFELENGLDPTHLKIAEHVDHSNPHTFEIDDLKKLIAKTTKDLNEADRKRREEFKEYEMHKKFDQEEKMKNMTEEDRKKYENELHDLEKKHKDHEPLHHPGSKKQLEEVWEKQDHMENQDFDPRTFFFLHDLDGNGVWDQNELKTLFLKELDKLYAEGHPEDDLVERAEELERMREHVVKEADLNRDGLISYEEFLNESKKAEFEQDPGWEPLDQQQIYSEQEYEEYKRQKAKEIERAIAKGMSHEYHPAGQPQAGHEQFPPHPNQVPQHGYVQQQHPQGYQGQVPQHQYPQQGQYVNQMPDHGQYVNQMPDHGQYNQMPPQQGQYQQMPPQGQYQQMPPQGQYHQLPPQQGQYQQGHPQQVHPQQVHPQQGHPQQLHPQQGHPQQVHPQQGQLGNQIPHQQPPQFHPNQQVPVSNNINQVPQQQNYPPTNQQAPDQVPNQQAPNQVPNQQTPNQVPNQQAPNQVPNQQAPNQVPNQQQFQQPPPVAQNINQIPHQQQQQNPQVDQVVNQPPPVVNDINQAPQQVQQQNQPSGGAAPIPNQQVPGATGQNQLNSQNQVPQQAHEQIASLNNAQTH